MNCPWSRLILGVVGVAGAVSFVLREQEPVVMASESEPPPSANTRHDASAGVARDLGAKPGAAHADRLNELEAVMVRFYYGNPLGKARSSLDQAIDKYNAWVKSANDQHQAAQAKLEKEFASVRGIERRIEDLDRSLQKKPNAQDEAAVEAYNTLVTKRNDLVGQHEKLGKAYKQREKVYNDSVRRSQQEIRVRKQQIIAQRAAVDEQMAAYRRWIESHEDVSFFRQLNGFFAELQREQAAGGTPQLAAMIDKVRSMRRELARHAVDGHRQAASGMVIVEATLCRREKCFLIVDTGATAVTIPPTLVNALGLSDRLGKKVEAVLAGGVRIRGRELTIPQLAVLGVEAAEVKAVVLDEPEAGVDGLLGLSYLNQFSFRIDQDHPDKLILKPKSGP